MYNRIEDFLDEHNIIYEYQFGFRKKYSTNHALLSIIEQIRTNLDNKNFACSIFVDLQKAFDTVDHKILLSKLSHYGIKGPVNNWLGSYLTNRSQSVTLNGTTSNDMKITCGVPQ
jgi:retron-type reverse transcriptase